MLNEHEMNLLVGCAAERDEEHAKNFGEEGLKFYHNLVKQMEENEKNGIKCTYDVGYDY